MARFYASIQGNRGEATRMGHKGITGHVRGWNIGARVTMRIDADDSDVVSIDLTSGSNGDFSSFNVGTFKLVNGELFERFHDEWCPVSTGLSQAERESLGGGK